MHDILGARNPSSLKSRKKFCDFFYQNFTKHQESFAQIKHGKLAASQLDSNLELCNDDVETTKVQNQSIETPNNFLSV